MDTGRAICLFLFTSSFVACIVDILYYVKALLIRMWDRKCRTRLKADQDDEQDDVVNTRQKVQTNLVQIHMGQIFNGEQALSRMMSTMFVILLYSSGMPILYFIGMLFFVTTYFAHKLLILKYY